MNTTKSTSHLTATMPHPNSHNLARAGMPLGRLLFAIVLMVGGIPLEPATAQIAGAARNAAARAAVRSAERSAVRSAVAKKRMPRPACAAIPNKCAGIAREAAARRLIKGKYPNERIQPETYLVNRNGRRAIDPKTRKARRIDFVTFSRDGYTRRFEVTSQRADKRAQLAKEQRILTRRRTGVRRTGPIYVRDRATGRLVPLRTGRSKIIRFQ